MAVSPGGGGVRGPNAARAPTMERGARDTFPLIPTSPHPTVAK